MTIQKTIPNPIHEAVGGIPKTGNAQAARAAAKSRTALESIMDGVRLRDLPTTKDRLLAVADAIEQERLAKSELKIGFNMATLYSVGQWADRTQHKCGTAACIAGWVSLLDDPDTRGDDTIVRRATEILGISDYDAKSLFALGVSMYELTHYSPAKAVAVIRNYAETGSVEWYDFDNDGKRIK